MLTIIFSTLFIVYLNIFFRFFHKSFKSFSFNTFLLLSKIIQEMQRKNFFLLRRHEKNWDFLWLTMKHIHQKRIFFCILRDQQSLLNKKSFSQNTPTWKSRFWVASYAEKYVHASLSSSRVLPEREKNRVFFSQTQKLE